MKSRAADTLMWAQRIMRNKDSLPHELLELPANATIMQAQEAFHRIARTAHPDLHRNAMTAEELELLTSAYATVANAYQSLRTQVGPGGPRFPRSGSQPPTSTPRPQAPPLASGSVKQLAQRRGPTFPRAGTSPPVAPQQAGPVPGGATTGQQMSPKALVYFRKAELCLKRGDLKGAVLQLKLAVASDPTSSFLRSALAEVELEARKT